MAHVTAPNYTLASANDTNSALWRLSRAMKAAGWVTRASSDGSSIDITGTYDNDKWNGVTGTGNSGAAATISSVTNGVATLTGLTGFAAATAGQRWITISGANTPGNNGTFKILSYVSATSVTIRNSGADAADSNNGSISWIEKIPLSDTYTAGLSAWICMQGPSTIKIPIKTLPAGNTVIDRTGNTQTGSNASITAVRGVVTVSGLTRMYRTSIGRLLTISGATTAANNGTWVITKLISDTSVIISNNDAVTDANNGSITWTEKTTKPFIRGENITQTTSGAQGEVIGIHFDLHNNFGYLVVLPRVIGSGSEVFGWSNSDDITGAISAAVLAAGGTLTEYVREIVLWAGSASTRYMTGYMQTVDSVSEATSRFSYLANSSGCTATIAPGGGGTDNGFPVPGSYVFAGTGGSKTDTYFGLSSYATLTNAQLMCADATFDTGRSADGSFVCANGTTTNAGSYIGFAFTRLDNHEDGDVDPYIIYAVSNENVGVPARTSLTSTFTTGDHFQLGSAYCAKNTFRGIFAKGLSNEMFYNYAVGLLARGNTGTGAVTGSSMLTQNYATREAVATALANTYVTEPLWVVSDSTYYRHIKGSCRWLITLVGGTGTDTLGTKSWLQLSSAAAGVPAIVAGPWDGSTTPVK